MGSRCWIFTAWGRSPTERCLLFASVLRPALSKYGAKEGDLDFRTHTWLLAGFVGLSLAIPTFVAAKADNAVPARCLYQVRYDEQGQSTILSRPRCSPTLQNTLQLPLTKAFIKQSKHIAFTQSSEAGFPYYIPEGKAPSGGAFRDILLTEEEARQLPVVALEAEPLDEEPELRTLVNSGDPANRINLAIIGDGYVVAEKERFFSDAARMVKGIFGDTTFASYLPLFNVYALYYPSVESGIGDGRPKNTAFGLYRDAVTRQAIMLRNADRASKVLAKAPRVDYPIVVGNEPLYGGLGGYYAITTNSVQSGLVVLRHELGHNFGRVGEEYDGGFVYSGANSSGSESVSWQHWLSNADDKPQRVKLHHLSAPWQNLKGKPYQFSFSPTEGFANLLFTFNTLGTDTKDDIALLLDGKQVAFAGNYSMDRNFYEAGVRGVEIGREYATQVEEKIVDGNNVLSKMHLYGLPDDYRMQAGYTGKFQTFNSMKMSVGYRPTHSTCLMRNMLSTSFCNVCLENMWLKFLAKISLIDGIAVENKAGVHSFSVKTLQLGNLRKSPLQGEQLAIHWFKNDVEIADFAGKFDVTLNANQAKGSWRVDVALSTPEIRRDPQHLTADSASWKVE